MHLKSQYLHRVNYVKYSYVYIVNDSVIYLCSVFADFTSASEKHFCFRLPFLALSLITLNWFPHTWWILKWLYGLYHSKNYQLIDWRYLRSNLWLARWTIIANCPTPVLPVTENGQRGTNAVVDGTRWRAWRVLCSIKWPVDSQRCRYTASLLGYLSVTEQLA